jgi:SHS family lactate transporter-like MFS transporter
MPWVSPLMRPLGLLHGGESPPRTSGFAWFAGCFGWMLDAFDHTIFLFIMVAVAEEFGVSVTAVAAILTLTIWFRFAGTIASGWLSDRIGRKGPLMLSILWFSVCNFIAGFSPRFCTHKGIPAKVEA